MATRCFGDGDPLYERYHDHEWGRPVVTEQGLFERICLEAFQSGLSWRIVLGKRESMREGFCRFDVEAVAAFDEDDVQRLLDDPAVIRNRRKIEAAVANARATLRMRGEGGISDIIWSHAVLNDTAPESLMDIASTTPGSTAVAKALKKMGFSFVGPTTIYASMQACGIVNDHIASCPVRSAVEEERVATLARMKTAPSTRPKG